VLELKGVKKAYGENVVLRHVDLTVERGDRIALVGPNGAGKSTLMRLLSAVDRPDDGVRLAGHQVMIDYFAQDQAAVLNSTRTVYEEMTAASPTTMVPLIRHILGGFLFSGDDVYKRVGVLSGGERNRLALAKMLLTPSNVLLLDEPTNHLDLDSKEVLLDALSDYGGTLIFVSHDRYFVDNLATRVVDVGGGEALAYPGGYEDFLEWKRKREAGLVPAQPPRMGSRAPHLRAPSPASSEAEAEVAAAPAKVSGNGQPAAGRPAPKAATARTAGGGKPAAAPGPPAAAGYDPLAPRLRPSGAPPDRQAREREARKLKARAAELERLISTKEQAVKDVEHLMATPGFYDDRATADRAVADRQKLLDEVATLMSEWETLQLQMEANG
jgi:ATP-binding cassette subfamily F protein 3